MSVSPTVQEESGNTRSSIELFWWGLVGLVVLCGVVSFMVAPTSNSGFRDAAAVVAFAGFIALGIERILEVLWVVIDRSRLGGYWPLKQLNDYLAKVETHTDQLAGNLLEEATSALESIRKHAGDGSAKAEEATEYLNRLTAQRTRLKAQLAEARRLAPGSARLTAFSNVASDATREAVVVTEYAGKTADGVREILNHASAGASAAMSIIATFQANPARRVTSLLIGASIGMLISGFAGVNLFAAILAPPPGETGQIGVLMGAVGVVVTGFVMGLGAGPTHELVKTLERIKESRNQTLVEGPGAGSSIAHPEVSVVAIAGGGDRGGARYLRGIQGVQKLQFNLESELDLTDEPESPRERIVARLSDRGQSDPFLSARVYSVRSTQ